MTSIQWRANEQSVMSALRRSTSVRPYLCTRQITIINLCSVAGTLCPKSATGLIIMTSVCPASNGQQASKQAVSDVGVAAFNQQRHVFPFESLTKCGYNDCADIYVTQQVITASPSEDWRRPPGRPRTTWMKTIQQDLTSNNLSLDEAITVAQNRPLWRLMSAFGATHP